MTEPYDARSWRNYREHPAYAYPPGQGWDGQREPDRQWSRGDNRYDDGRWQREGQWHGDGTVRTRPRRADASRWHWLLLVAVIVPLLTPLYNRIEPQWLGLPFFYWCQLAFAVLSTVVITTVHIATRARRRG